MDQYKEHTSHTGSGYQWHFTGTFFFTAENRAQPIVSRVLRSGCTNRIPAGTMPQHTALKFYIYWDRWHPCRLIQSK